MSAPSSLTAARSGAAGPSGRAAAPRERARAPPRAAFTPPRRAARPLAPPPAAAAAAVLGLADYAGARGFGGSPFGAPAAAAAAAGINARWFQAAVRDVVRHLEDAPFFELVRLPRRAASSSSSGATSSSRPDSSSAGFGSSSGFGSAAAASWGSIDEDADAELAAYAVPPGVVAAPELWRAVAETVSATEPDVVILVQRVDASGGALTDGAAARSRAADACRALVAAGVGERVADGQVGDCCEEEGGAAAPLALAAAAPRGAAAPLAGRAPPGPGPPPPLSGHWGVVVQSRQRTGVEGCYLLRAVRAVGAPGCACTHFSLTRVCAGENLERQFVDAWLA
jgi:hypothetical protein